jgi:DNA polymerase V
MGTSPSKPSTSTPNRVVLHPENPTYPDVEVPSLSELVIWGVVIYAIRHVNQRKHR